MGVDDTNEYVDGSYNIRATYNGSGWVMDQRVLLTDKAARVRAYYPYDSEAVDGHLDIDLNAIDGADDLLIGSATTTVDMNSPTAHIEFKHVLTRLTFAISCNEGEHMLNSVLLRSASNTLRTIAAYSLLYGSDYAYSGGESKDKHYIKKEVNATVNGSQSQIVNILVYPIEGAEGEYTLEVTLDGKPYIIPLPAVNWEAGQQYTYPISIEGEFVRTPAKVGDYYYSDGTWSTEYNASKQCIGIVFALTDTEGGEINRNLTESMHGRIIALQDVAECQWGSVGEDIAGIPNFVEWFNESPAQLHVNEYGCISDWPTGGCVTDFNGYENTQYINDSSHPAGYACYTYKTVGTNSGEWYLPACGEMELLEKLYYESFISNSKQAVFENWSRGFYWTSTELEANAYYNEYVRAFTVNIMTNSGSHNEKNENHPVRAAKAF